jgi:putative endonuclease
MPPSRSKPASKARVAAERGGRWAEALAAWYLRAKLYTIVARRVKTPVGEIDLIVRRFGVTVFVEVKARRDRTSEAATLEAISQRRIVRAAQYYIARHPHLAAAPLRFDVLLLLRGAWPRHLVNAFDSSAGD